MAARLKELGPAGGLEYPRFDYQGRSLRIALFRDLFSKAKAKEMEEEEGLFTLSGTLNMTMAKLSCQLTSFQVVC